MEYKIYKREDYRSSRWAGGETTQLAIYPADGNYLERNFVWRLSSATCELEESKFSKLPDFDRVLIVLKGEVVLAHENVRVAKLAELEQDSFDGAYKTTSFGQITDYNLMVRKGNRGSAKVLELGAESQELEIGKEEGYDLASQAIYLRDGYATVTLNGKTMMLGEGEQFVVNYDQRENLKISLMGEGHAVWCQVFYNYRPGDLGAVKIEKKPASMADFREAMFISRTQYRFSKYTNKRLKTLWYDEELQEGISRMNQFYIPDIVLLVGACIVAGLGMGHVEGAMWAVLFIAWFLIWFLLVSPLMYFLVLPKPVAEHMKAIDKLTPYEQELREAQLGRNERVEKILGRYKITGTMKYDEDGNRIDDYRIRKS